jgi:predicted component of type VI protein secretion system
MKLSLVVATRGNKMEGKVIPIALPQFLIGRDPQCQLRPASSLISKRHCALLMREEKAFVQDFGSTNGTLVNQHPVRGEQELHNGDLLQVGPLEFRVVVEASPPPPKPPAPPRPVVLPATSSDDDAAAAMLLSVPEAGAPDGQTPAVDSDGVPTGSTVMIPAAPDTENSTKPDNDKGGAAREAAAKAAQGNTSSAAKAILEKYMRRPRDR